MINKENLVLTDNAYFYKTEERITIDYIKTLFNEISEIKIGNFLLKIIGQKYKENIRYSICVFKFKSKPTFLDDAVEEEFEIKYAYFILVEYKGLVIVNKRNIASLKSLYEKIDEVDYETISRLYVSNSTMFEKFSLQNMNISSRALKNKNIEAVNIRENFSALGANRYILSSMRVQEKRKRLSLTFNTSRISQLGTKSPIEGLFDWIQNVGDSIETFSKSDSYLDIFAIPLDFEKNIGNSIPTCILFQFDNLIDEFKEDSARIFFKDGDKEAEIDYDVFFDNFNVLFDIEVDNGLFKIINPIAEDLLLVKNPKSFTIYSPSLKNYMIEREGVETLDFVTYVNLNKNFLVTLDKVDLVYFSRKLFRDSKLLENIEGFLSIFKPFKELDLSTGEKGGLSETQTKFDKDCLFGLIENKFANDDDFIICDDLGNEWADFVSIKNGNSVTFYHAKSAPDKILSASAFHEVVSQAVKNLGNLTPDESLWDKKSEHWKDTYNGKDGKKGVKTAIPRLRKGDDIDAAILKYKEVLFLPNTSRNVVLVVDFISLDTLRANLYQLKDTNDGRYKNQVIQIVWIISSLISCCYEVGVNVYIYCRKNDPSVTNEEK